MPSPTEYQIRQQIVGIIQNLPGERKVWNRIRIPTDDASFKRLCCDATGQVHVYYVRRVALTLERTGLDDLVSETHIYEIRGARGIVDSDVDEAASENLFQEEIEAIRAAIDADKHIGFDDFAVSHSGFEIPIEMPPAADLGAYQVHMMVARLAVRLEEC